MTCSCLRGVSRWFNPWACAPCSPELSKSYMDMASKLLTFTFTFTPTWAFVPTAGQLSPVIWTLLRACWPDVHQLMIAPQTGWDNCLIDVASRPCFSCGTVNASHRVIE